MSDTTRAFEPNEVQQLHLQLAMRNWDVVAAERAHMDAEIRFNELARRTSEVG